MTTSRRPRLAVALQCALIPVGFCLDVLEHETMTFVEYEVEESPGYAAASERFVRNGGSIGRSFEELDLGFGLDEARNHLAQARVSLGLDGDRFARFVGACMGFAMTCVEQDRGRRDG